MGVVRAGFAAGVGWVTAAALLLVLVIAAALVSHTSRMLLGSPPDGPGTATGTRRLPMPTAFALIGGLLVCVVLGVVAGPLATLLRLAAETTVGAR
ncbi:hypothetical protein [Actinocrispum wychmicini]|uniref:hypothetical protein n=1 Tax=Actinocrispum wychmicini TaxID=1213861 RepID=UPI001FB58377|nr:hypothetical protein [Actinocrispum wychmicini]